MMLSVLLVLGGLGGAAASDLHVFGKSFHGDDPLALESSHDSQLNMLRKQLHQQVRSKQELLHCSIKRIDGFLLWTGP